MVSALSVVWRAVRRWCQSERSVLGILFSSQAAAYLVGYWLHPFRPVSPVGGRGWWGFIDQGLYLRSTLAWAAGDLSGPSHWYPSLYPMLGAGFVRVTPANPFLLPDLALLLAAMWLTGGVAARLAPGWGRARVAGCATFVACSVLQPYLLDVWIVPWTTTPASVLALGCMVAVLDVVAGPADGMWRRVAVAALCGVGIAAFRPSEAASVCAVAGVAILLRLLTAWPGRVRGAAVLAAGFGVGGVVAALLLALHVVVHGWSLDGYLTYSARLGFEWRIVPLQWVMIVLDPRPFLSEAPGLVGRFPWLAPGLAGMVACLLWPPFGGTRARHGVVLAMMAAHMVAYLAYRDLHIPGLWRYRNLHYFKWILPLFGWYAVLLAVVVVRARWAGVTGVVAAAALLAWRVETVPAGPGTPATPGQDVALPAGMTVWDALVVPAAGSFDPIYQGVHHYAFPPGGVAIEAPGRIVAYAIAGGLVLSPVAPLPPGPGVMRFGAGVKVAAGELRPLRLRLVFGVPCWLPRWLGRPSICEDTTRAG